jgi:hypothetical protein
VAATWEPYVAAAFAPAVVWLLWRAQTLSVEGLRWSLVRMSRHGDLKWLYAIVSWFGVLLHEMSHALVLLLSGHGIKEFSVKVERGFVQPTRMKKGAFSFLFFLVAALAPLFLPPVLFLAGLWWLGHANPVGYVVPAAGAGLDAAKEALRAMLVAFPKHVVLAIARIDLSDWRQCLLFAVVLIGMPSARPSFVKGSRFHGEQDQGDVAVIRSRIRENPLPLVVFLVLLYGAYFLFRSDFRAVYWVPLESVWAVAMTGVVLAVFGTLWWALWWLAGRAMPVVNLLPVVAFAATEILLRRQTPAMALETLNGVSVGVWLIAALAIAQILPRRRAMRF